MLKLIIILVVAAVIGMIGDAIVKNSMPGGILGSIVAGFAGAWLGTLLLGSWGPVLAGFAVIPAILGAALFVFLIGMISNVMRRA